ncbi:MAG: biopolymer transporter ExbD [Deltaproteobacteria bacterium]|nr:biopolymer transporter ExbD [Deltaproteobacteria bacterium]
MRIRRADEEELRPDLTPLVDVVFLLIIFFMVSTHFIERSVEIDPDIPKSKQGLAPEQIKRQIVEINDQRRIFLNGEELPLKSLAEQLQTQPAIRSVLIRADKRLPFGVVMEVIDSCRAAGMKDIRSAVD